MWYSVGMSIKLSTTVLGRGDLFKFNPADLVANFAAYTGRTERRPEAIEAMIESLLADGQEQAILFRRGFSDKAIPVSGHTRIIAAAAINERRLNGYSPENPFVITATLRTLNEEEAILHTFRENDDDTRTPMNAMDRALLIRVLSENYGLSDAQIAAKLRKTPLWVSQHKALLTLDSSTQAAVAAGTIAVSTAQVVAQVAPEDRADVLAAATKPGKKTTARSVAAAAREGGATTSKVLKRSDGEFKDWVNDGLARCSADSDQGRFLQGIIDFRAGKLTGPELTQLFWQIGA
jgi:ParB-like chromosome segregation protein Spo0J